MPASSSESTSSSSTADSITAPQGVTKQHKTERCAFWQRERVIDEPAYKEKAKNSALISRTEKNLKKAKEALEAAEEAFQDAQNEVYVQRVKDPDITKCFLDWARGLRTCAEPSKAWDSEYYLLKKVQKVWVDELKKAGLADKFKVEPHRYIKDGEFWIYDSDCGPYDLKSEICFDRITDSHELIPKPHEPFIKMLEYCGVEFSTWGFGQYTNEL